MNDRRRITPATIARYLRASVTCCIDSRSAALFVWRKAVAAGYCSVLLVGLGLSMMPAANADATLPLPLAGAAYAVAQQAQQDYNAHRYDASATQAREAIRQRPDVLTLRLLLANAQVAGGHAREALQTIDTARHDFGDQRVLLTRREQIVSAGKPFVPTPAFRQAQAAYRAYAKQDFAGAEAAARQSLSLDPNAMPIRLLLVDALAAQHKDAEAYAMIQAALPLAAMQSSPLARVGRGGRTGGARDEADAQRDLAEREAVVGARLAIPAATASALALKNGDAMQAVTQAKVAVRYAPNDPTYREQWVAALLAEHQPQATADAVDQATAAMALHSIDGASDNDPSGAVFLVWRAFARAQATQNDTALADASAALQRLAQVDVQADPNATASDGTRAATDKMQAIRSRAINARLSIADLALALGNAQIAKDALAPLYSATHRHAVATDINAVAVSQRWHETRRLAAGVADTTAGATAARPRALPPVLDCTVSTDGPACMIYPFDPAFAAYQRGARAFDQGHADEAVAAAREAVAIAPADATHQMLLIDALHAAGDDAASRRAASQAVDAGLLDSLPDLQGAYVAAAANRPQLAAPRFQRADARGDLPPSDYLDAGYAVMQSGSDLNSGPNSGRNSGPNSQRETVASSYFKRAIDANDSGVIHMIPDQLLDTRRTESEIDRRGGLTVSTSYRPGGASGLSSSPGAAPTATTNRSLQTSVEGYWRPWGEMNGHIVEVYARASGTALNRSEEGAAGKAGIASLSGAVGVRGRPFASQNLVLAFEREIPLGSQSISDWLARVAYSNGFGTAIRQDVPSWWTGTVYGEVGRYLDEGKNYWTAEGDLGRTYRIDALKPEATVFPYVVIGGDYNQLTNNGFGVGIGPGVTMRYQFREDRYHAPQSYVQASVQYRFKIAGDDRAQGVFLNLTYGY